MKQLSLLLIASLCLFSCHKNNNDPKEETITKGERWGIKIGSSFEEVYAQLQISDAKYHFAYVGLDDQPALSSFSEIKDRLPYYYSLLMIKKNTNQMDRVGFTFFRDTIDKVYVTLPVAGLLNQWPQNAADDKTIKLGSKVSDLGARLQTILELPEYKDQYDFAIAAKTLSKAYDPAMAQYNGWSLGFATPAGNGLSDSYHVKLTFENGKLIKIYYEKSSGVVID